MKIVQYNSKEWGELTVQGWDTVEVLHGMACMVPSSPERMTNNDAEHDSRHCLPAGYGSNVRRGIKRP